MMDDATEFTHLFGQLYLHLHPRTPKTGYRPSRESMAVLRHLAVAGPVTVQTAARHFERSQSAMSEMLQRLMARGLVSRRPGDSDRRLHFVWLTEEGRRLVSAHSQPLDETQVRRALARLEPDTRRELIRLVRRVASITLELAEQDRKERQNDQYDHM